MSKVQQYEECPGEGIYRRADESLLTVLQARAALTPWGVIVGARWRSGPLRTLSMSRSRFLSLRWLWRLGPGARIRSDHKKEILAAILELSNLSAGLTKSEKSKLDQTCALHLDYAQSSFSAFSALTVRNQVVQLILDPGTRIALLERMTKQYWIADALKLARAAQAELAWCRATYGATAGETLSALRAWVEARRVLEAVGQLGSGRSGEPQPPRGPCSPFLPQGAHRADPHRG